MPGTILFSNVVAKRGFSSHDCVTKINKEVLGTKEQKSSETREVVKQGRSPSYTCRYTCRYTSGDLIPTSVMVK